MRPLLVGEDNPYGRDPRYALYPAPDYSAGGRLCFQIMKLSVKEYIKRFDRVNLCAEKWGMKEARKRAEELLESHDVFVLLGSKVCKAFGLEFRPFTVYVVQRPREPLARVIVLPHPSGLNRIWNDPAAFERARTLLIETNILEA